ncbi:hypothetical protein K3G39_08495 [Pontibacter sp. HSC-14F20]|uniref:hypothetical protein n=1 Tax=Pontibacter sp. HSC-14F20 TaxID=2864136 RepID=UPI001C72CDCD|nr:hypothetical protein [Pontibacter sp. HSC-14F20]MBX0333276.1 hypothetical protein [Pontibacter sp. HSC-14F20]
MKLHHLLHLTCALLLVLTACKNTPPVETITFRHPYKFQSDIAEKLEKDTVAWKHQFAASDFATKGDYRKALEQWDVAFPGRYTAYTRQELDALRERYKVVPAADYIMAQAKSNQVMIINEAHHSSLHRVFTRSLLQRLYDNGYRNLGLEALTNGKLKDSLLHDRKYPVMETGYYTQDPQFGNLIRTALEIGYKVFPYETTNRNNGKPREIDQARNIQEVIKSRPNEKFLIHCGFGHVVEGEHGQWEKAMAGRLAEFTGIDPLTIDQVHYSEKSRPARSHPLLQAFNISQPSVLLDHENQPFRFEQGNTWADVAVLHPFTSDTNERPGWLFGNGNKSVPVELSNIQLEYPVLLLAFKEGENVQEAVPVDILEVPGQQSSPRLSLPEGSYELVVVNRKEEARKLTIKVK